MRENKEHQSVQNWTSISREELKNAEIRSLNKRRRKKLTSLCATLLILILILMIPFLKQDKRKSNQDLALKETAPSRQDLPISHSAQDALDWSYAAGMGHIESFQKALANKTTGFDPEALPGKEEIIKARLDDYGHPYVMDGDRFFIFYFQDHEQPWSDMEHGESTVEKSGCGTLCLSMVLTSLTGDIEAYRPDKLVSFLKEEHIAAPNLSVRSIPVTNRLLKTGIKIKKFDGPMDLDQVDKTLKKGGYIILDQFKYVGQESSSTFAAKNHYIVIRGGNQKDGYYIANPLYGYSSQGSEAAFAPQNTTQIPAKYFSAFYYYTVLP